MAKGTQRPFATIRREVFRSEMIVITLMTVLITAAGILLNLYYERKRVDQNLQNVAETIAHAQVVQEAAAGSDEEGDPQTLVKAYLDTVKASLSNIDVISVTGADGIRRYHSSPEFIGTHYDGTIPEFICGEREFYASDDIGPSGRQRRAYAAVYGEDGTYLGFVLAVMLRENQIKTVLRILAFYLAAAAVVVFAAAGVAFRLSERMKERLMGYEPDVFGAMFRTRDDILESLEEGIVAVDRNGETAFINKAAAKMFQDSPCPDPALRQVLKSGVKEINVSVNPEGGEDILADRLPIMQQEEIIGAVGIYRNRTEYTKLMEDLSGVRYMVDSMRASNHDFTNKLHVILGLIEMGQYQEAVSYIMSITLVERETIHTIMHAIEEPGVAALLIGKHARSSELNIRFRLKTGSSLPKGASGIPAGSLITLIGNLIDNALESINTRSAEADEQGELAREVTVGIFAQDRTIFITVDDTGCGIEESAQEHMFDFGYSTKGEGRGTGLYLVKQLAQTYGGSVGVESEPGIGTSFFVTLKG